jgi:hypothetical protein
MRSCGPLDTLQQAVQAIFNPCPSVNSGQGEDSTGSREVRTRHNLQKKLTDQRCRDGAKQQAPIMVFTKEMLPVEEEWTFEDMTAAICQYLGETDKVP